MTDNTKRPNRTTMAGMIYNSHQVLEWVLDPKTGGIDPALFGPSLKGICFISVVEAGFILSGNVGTGIVLTRHGGNWSPPSGTFLFT
jgi:lipid-binding SYLF domain-containing protein